MNYEQLTDDELNKLVAEKVMGWECRELFIGDATYYLYYKDKEHNVCTDSFDWQPATNIAQAFGVVDKMIADGWFVEAFGLTDDKDFGVSLTNEKHILDWEAIEAYDKSLPRAICIAALKAVE